MSQNEKQAAQQWVGRQFRVKTDLYVFKSAVADRTYVGANLGELTKVSELPEEVSEKNIGKETLNSRIVGVVRSGSIFTVRKVVYARPGGAKTFSLIGDVSGKASSFENIRSDCLQKDWYVESPADIALLPQLLEEVK
ncbi:MAG: hypothetical protein QM760_02195 [Nibricoccus sp.]